MAGWALGLLVAYLALAFGVRVAVSIRTIGRTGVVAPDARVPIEWLGGSLFLFAIVLGALNPLLALLDVIEPWDFLDTGAAHAVGLVVCGIGITGTFVAQMAMGDSWRIGVDPEERTELVTGGVFALCRNPIYSFMIVAWIGFALLVPTWIALLAGLLLVGSIELQVRLVEEPHLMRTHGEPYRAWASRVGRFLPGLGRLSGGGPA